ncbi:asparagine synthase-related protein [Streptacidiphilus anmyonensis]|uniref:asparagine synthase-related protein n=1 Tax=Streptacidiphilus anmyonensis TaxID=405782 RepID=UPI000693804E|nr:asparagine synthase-related protein [Streptacidiphilus anmyonensis]
MRWVVGWNGVRGRAGQEAAALRPVGGRLLWPGNDPLWVVGDWRPDEIRGVAVYRHRRHHRHVVQNGFPELDQLPAPSETGAPTPAFPPDDGALARLFVLGRCGAADSALRTALLATSGGALRHLTTWPGSYVVVLQQGTRVAVLGDLAGVQPVYYTGWRGGTAWATAALPLADLVEAPVDHVHLAARLALPDSPEGVGDTSPFLGVRRVTPGQALSMRAGAPDVAAYESLPGGVGSYEMTEASATAEVTRSLLESVRLRVRTPAPRSAFGAGMLRAASDEAAAGGAGTGGAGTTAGSAGAGAPGVAGVAARWGSGWSGASQPGFAARRADPDPPGGMPGRHFRRGPAAADYGDDESDHDHDREQSRAGRDPGRGTANGTVNGTAHGGGTLTPRPAVSVDLSGGSASTVLTLLAAGIPRASGAVTSSRTQRPGSTSFFYGGSDETEPDLGGERHPDPDPDPATLPSGTASARHPTLGTFSEERWGDPRSSRTLRHGPPGVDPDEASAAPRRTGAVRGSWARNGAVSEPETDTLLAITYTDAEGATGAPLGPGREAELLRARAIAEAVADRIDHVVVPGGQDALPFADLADDPLAGPLTDEPGPALVTAVRQRARLAAAGVEHISGHGARQVLDGHPARLADLLYDRRRSPLLRPVAALTRADSAALGAAGLGTPVSVVRAARRLARTGYVEGLEAAAAALLRGLPGASPHRGSAGEASTRALAWCTPGPAADWLTEGARGAVANRLRLAARAGAPDERPGARRARLALQRRAADFRVLAQVVESAPDARGRRLHAPFLDNQVVRACRQVPDRARIQPGARQGILRAVLAGAGVTTFLDDLATTGPAPHDASPSTATMRAGLRRSGPALDHLLATSLLGRWGVIDVPHARKALAAATSETTPGPLDGLPELIATELWVRRLHSRRGSCWSDLRSPSIPAVGG